MNIQQISLLPILDINRSIESKMMAFEENRTATTTTREKKKKIEK